MPDTSLIQFIAHPAVGQLPPLLTDSASPYTGNVTIHDFYDTDGGHHQVVDTFGVYYACFAPPGIAENSGVFSRLLGWDPGTDLGVAEDRYEERLVQIVAQHQTELGLGVWLSDQVEDIHQPAGYVLWREALPGRIGLYTFPNLYVNLSFFVIPGS